ncbi:ABC transporter permease [Candidatus Falkowbacteria bacterium]|nr:ABC transporter permease [Candidatus Falkowbacteria bacterium]
MNNYLIKKYETPFQIASGALLKNKTRTILSILGVVIGIAAVIIVLSLGQAIKGFMVSQMTSFGTDFIEVEIKVPNTAQTSTENVSGMAYGIQITTLTTDDMEEILKLDNIKNAYAANMAQEVVSYQENNKSTFIFATTAGYIDIDPIGMAEGRFFTDEEDKSLAKVAVIGQDLKQILFGDDEAIGKDIKVKKRNYKVIGILNSKGSVSFLNFDQMLFLPLRTTQKLLMGIDYVSFIFAQVYDNNVASATAAEIIEVMREQHDITDPSKDDFAVITMAEAMSILDTVTGAITLLLIAIAGISLVVGGVGIMNIMYVSVAERTFEIGLRKAVGAKKEDILIQFLMEAIFITFSGGIVGIVVGVGASLLITFIAGALGYTWTFSFTPLYFLIACGVSILVGLISGIYPARNAANLDPIVALRNSE